MEKETYKCDICPGIVPKDKFLAIDFRDSHDPDGSEKTIYVCEICAKYIVDFIGQLRQKAKSNH